MSAGRRNDRERQRQGPHDWGREWKRVVIRLNRGIWYPVSMTCIEVKRCQGSAEGVAGVAFATGLVPEVGAKSWGSWSRRFLGDFQVPDHYVLKQGD